MVWAPAESGVGWIPGDVVSAATSLIKIKLQDGIVRIIPYRYSLAHFQMVLFLGIRL